MDENQCEEAADYECDTEGVEFGLNINPESAGPIEGQRRGAFVKIVNAALLVSGMGGNPIQAAVDAAQLAGTLHGAAKDWKQRRKEKANADAVRCQWSECGEIFRASEEALAHVRDHHNADAAGFGADAPVFPSQSSHHEDDASYCSHGGSVGSVGMMPVHGTDVPGTEHTTSATSWSSPPTKTTQFECSVCGMVFTDYARAKEHGKSHISQPPPLPTTTAPSRTYSYVNAPAASTTHAPVVSHAGAMHRCGVCGATFKSLEETVRHQATMHRPKQQRTAYNSAVGDAYTTKTCTTAMSPRGVHATSSFNAHHERYQANGDGKFHTFQPPPQPATTYTYVNAPAASTAHAPVVANAGATHRCGVCGAMFGSHAETVLHQSAMHRPQQQRAAYNSAVGNAYTTTTGAATMSQREIRTQPSFTAHQEHYHENSMAAISSTPRVITKKTTKGDGTIVICKETFYPDGVKTVQTSFHPPNDYPAPNAHVAPAYLSQKSNHSMYQPHAAIPVARAYHMQG